MLLNNKYNVIYHGGDELLIKTPKGTILYFGDLHGCSRLKNMNEKDEVFSGNLIIKKRVF